MSTKRPSFFDLVEPGMVSELGSHTFTADAIRNFAAKYDPQPFHLDEAIARESLFGGLCASGWHTVSAWMRLYVDNGRDTLVTACGYEGPDPVFGPSPGVSNIRWLKPVFAGDTIRYTSAVSEKRTSRSKPGWGLLMQHSEGTNAAGDVVVSLEGAVMLRVD